MPEGPAYACLAEFASPEALIEATTRARADGYRALSLSVARDNAPLVAFYEHHGFSVVGDGDDQSLTMRREL